MRRYFLFVGFYDDWLKYRANGKILMMRASALLAMLVATMPHARLGQCVADTLHLFHAFHISRRRKIFCFIDALSSFI